MGWAWYGAVAGVAAAGPERSRNSYDAKTNNGLAGLRQLDGLGTTAGRASASAGEDDGGVIFGVVGFGLILGPAPFTHSALVNEGEGADIVSHTYIRCQNENKVKLRKYREQGDYRLGVTLPRTGARVRRAETPAAPSSKLDSFERVKQAGLPPG